MEIITRQEVKPSGVEEVLRRLKNAFTAEAYVR
jgi:hypothetical protein